MRLDVGCGTSPIGDVNTDIDLNDSTGHRHIKGAIPVQISPKQIANFIETEGCNLPFPDNSFSEVYCRQVIEHIKKPLTLVKELTRVSSDRVIIETYHYLAEAFEPSLKRKHWYRTHHISSMNITRLNNLASSCGLKVAKSYVSSWLEFPHAYFSILKFPAVIGIEGLKR